MSEVAQQRRTSISGICAHRTLDSNIADYYTFVHKDLGQRWLSSCSARSSPERGASEISTAASAASRLRFSAQSWVRQTLARQRLLEAGPRGRRLQAGTGSA